MDNFTNNLVSLGKLCDAGCTIFLNKTHLLVRNGNGELILTGNRETTGARLWRVNIDASTTPQSLAATRQPPSTPVIIPGDDDDPVPSKLQQQPRTPPPPPAPTPVPPVEQPPTLATHSPATRQQTKPTTHARAYDLPSVPQLIAYLHATAGYPVKSTWLAAVKRGAYASWPGLTPVLIARYCPDADETRRGHTAQPRQHIRSTQQPTMAPTVRPSQQTQPVSPTVEIHEIALTQLFTDDTGRFHPRAQSGNQYIMVGLHSASNAILVRPFATKHDTHRIPAYQELFSRLALAGAPPTTHIMDNEASAALQRAITANGCTLQLVPPHVHRRNAAERAIRTFKDHFLTILAGVTPTFPANRWDLLLPQAELTLNLLRPTAHPTATSAWEALFGPYNFDATPMGPAGCLVHIHNKATTRKSWDFRTQDGYYVGPARQHYRCYRVLTKEARTVIVSDAIKFRPHNLPTPTITTEDKIIHALHTINTTLGRSLPGPNDKQLAAIAALREILRAYTAPPPPGVPNQQPLPGVQPCTTTPTLEAAGPPPGVPTPHPASEWTTVHPRRARPQEQHQPPDAPIASRTRAQTHTNRFALLAADDDTDNEVDTTTPTRPSAAPGLDALPIAAPVLDAKTGQLLEHRQLRKHPEYKDIWDTSYSNELGRLCQGVGTNNDDPSTKRVEGTDTFRVIHYNDIPPERRGDVTYTRVVCEVRPQKEDPNRTRITIGGNRICYPGDTGTKTGSLELVKLQLNSVLSTDDARFACYDLKNFYLGTPMDRPEYVRIRLSDIPHEFIEEYDLTKYANNGWIYFEITKGVYGLKQAGKLANDLLTERLEPQGYYQCPTTPGLWRHKWRPISFVLIVDDFGLKYVGKRHAEHLYTALTQHYTVTTDWTGSKFAGIDIEWDYTKRTCRLTMKNYINELLLKYDHAQPRKPQHSPHAHKEIVYGAKEQFLPESDSSPLLDAKGIKRIQGIIGSLLYYARAVDNKLLATLSTISSQQACATENTNKAVNQLLDYVATYPNDGVTYRASNMVLAAHSDASFLTEHGSRSRAGAHIFLSEDDPIPRNNGPILTISQIIKFVMASAAEAELAGLYITAREMIPLRNALEEMGWKQPRSPIQTDNSAASGFISDTIIQRRIKMIWMRLHWLRCRAAQGQFRFYWDRGASNLADYHTKHHPPAYHLAHRATHVG
jgi:hypothetical protein